MLHRIEPEVRRYLPQFESRPWGNSFLSERDDTAIAIAAFRLRDYLDAVLRLATAENVGVVDAARHNVVLH